MLYNIDNLLSKSSFKEFFCYKQPKCRFFFFWPISEFYGTHSSRGIGGKDDFEKSDKRYEMLRKHFVKLRLSRLYGFDLEF